MLSWNFLNEYIEDGPLYLDCRSESLYDQGTIEGAYGAAYIKKPFGSGPQSLGRLSGFLNAVIETAGKMSKSKIIVFDEGVGMYASRMAWLLMGAGFESVQILSLRFQEIPGEMMGKGAGQITGEEMKAPLNIKGISSITQVQQNLTRVQLLDVRTPEEYNGDIPRMSNFEPGSICGRIPGSLNWDWRRLYGPDGHLKDKSEIIVDIRSIGLIQERPTVIYDFNGARSSTTALVLSRCGYRQVNIYLGSWMEWRKSRLPKQNMNVWAGEAVR